MGITTIEEHLHGSDMDATCNANIISKGFGVCTTGVKHRPVLGQDLFGIPHNVRQRRTWKKLRTVFLPST